MPSAGFLIYSGVMPLIKTFLSILLGYILARTDRFPKVASRGASEVTMTVSLPALIFANIVPAFTPQNVSAIGPLFLVSFVYQAIGLMMGLIIREICYVPRNFWQGIVIITMMSNWGNLPNAVVLSVTQQKPFDPATDPALGVSFVAIFIVSYNLVFWVLGGAHSLSWDYLPGVPQGEEAEARYTWDQKPIGSLIARYILEKRPQQPPNPNPKALDDVEIVEKGKEMQDEKSIAPAMLQSCQPIAPYETNVDLARRSTRTSQTLHQTTSGTLPPVTNSANVEKTDPHKRYTLPPLAHRILGSIKAALHPVTISLLIAIPIALIKPLKALFVIIPDGSGPVFSAPDGRPPLAFIIDTANFVGGITVPLALMLLGASFARLKIPRPLSRLPIMAMLSVTLSKMLLLPVVGVFVVRAMVSGGLINQESRVEKFVAMFLSGTPAAVNQLIMTSLYSPDGDVDTLSAFLLAQYIFMFFSSSALTAVALLLS